MTTTHKHTPGPWHIQTPRKGYVYIIGALDQDARDDGTPMQLSTHVCDVIDNENEQANARLIAAAPDLLAALRAVDMECREIGGGDVSIPSYIMDLIMQAIAKAEGRE